jgi:hypothetical protein
MVAGGSGKRLLARAPLTSIRIVLPMSGHVVLPAAEETRCEWSASDVWLVGHNTREET